MPRFETRYRTALRDTLESLGVKRAFEPHTADFSGMARNGGLCLRDAHHAVVVRVNETGTEAAAASAVVMQELSASDRVERFIVDHPFLFAIRHVRSGALLFLGRVMDPVSRGG
jgi:serpin B